MAAPTVTSIVNIAPDNPEATAVSIVQAMSPALAAGCSRYQTAEQVARFWLALMTALLGSMAAHIGHAAAVEVLRQAACVPDAPPSERAH
jgi:hypothetical protein